MTTLFRSVLSQGRTMRTTWTTSDSLDASVAWPSTTTDWLMVSVWEEREREREFDNIEPFSAAFFIRPFYKMMLKKPVTLDDMQSVVSTSIDTYMYISHVTLSILCLATPTGCWAVEQFLLHPREWSRTSLSQLQCQQDSLWRGEAF